ncbi:MAG: helix-turn-helix domain-containing protein [Gammaproteobacteria bacterium]|nr:helix-turn-helix domain-containing protein [Gammaproteobacteria bacterium]
MKPTATEETLESPRSEGPGRQLKTVREAEGLELSRVAVLLHLSEAKLEALEADDYGQLPGAVFVQGYLRNYARLLGVPVEPVLNAYHAANPRGARAPDLRLSKVRHEVGSGHAVVKLVTWGIVILLLALLVVWWRGYLQWPMQLPGVGQSTDASGFSSDETNLPDDGAGALQPVTEVDASGEAALTLPRFAPEPEPASLPAESLVPEPAPEPEAESPVTPEAAPSGEPTTATVEPPAAAEPTPISPPAARVVLEFSGTSWTKIQDASGEFRVEGQIKAGARQALEGLPPYRLVLGNASVVRMLVDGEELDLTPYTRGNVARFSFDPDN